MALVPLEVSCACVAPDRRGPHGRVGSAGDVGSAAVVESGSLEFAAWLNHEAITWPRVAAWIARRSRGAVGLSTNSTPGSTRDPAYAESVRGSWRGRLRNSSASIWPSLVESELPQRADGSR